MRRFLTRVLYTRPYREIVLFLAPSIFLICLVVIGFVLEGSQQFTSLAQAFLHGQTNFLHPIGGLGQDPVFYHGKIYWSEEPFPAIILMPFVAFFNLFHIFFYQGYIKWALTLGIVYLVFKLARLLAYSVEDSLIMMFGFTLGSVFIGVDSVSSSWLYAQVLTTFLLFWSLYEFYTRTRWWLIGIICGLIVLTRPPAAPILLFFILELWQANSKLKTAQKITKVVKLSLPTFIGVVIIGLYNYIRFHSPLDGGNKYQLLGIESAKARALGIFSFRHIPSNFYYMFISSPSPVLNGNLSWILKFPFVTPNEDGMSIFFTSPYLLYLFTQKWSSFSRQAKNLIVASSVSLLLVLTYFGVGKAQYGYRYTLDFLPEVFVLFMILYRRKHRYISKGMKLLLLGAGVVNFILLWSYI
jgi:hypothetical protein